MTRVLVLGGTDTFVARMNVLPGAQVLSLDANEVSRPGFDLVRLLDPAVLPELVLLGDEMPLPRALQIAAELDRAFPTVDVVLVGDHPADVAVDAMRAGVRDILGADSPETDFVTVVRRAEQSRAATPARSDVGPTQQADRTSRTVTVLSPKGGVGKTSIATNVAIGLAAGKPQDVVLVDLDLQFGDVAATLDLAPGRTMEDALSPAAAADTLVLKTMLTVHEAGFFVLCGADSPAANEHVTGDQVKRLLAQLSTQFSMVIVDTAAGLDEPTMAALEVSDEVVLVSTMDVACVRSVRREVDLLTQIGLLPTSRTFALNLADKQSGMKVKDVEAVVGLPVDVVIPRTSAVQLAANHGRPLMLKTRRGGPFVKAIRRLVAKLDRAAPEDANKHRRLEVA